MLVLLNILEKQVNKHDDTDEMPSVSCLGLYGYLANNRLTVVIICIDYKPE